MTIWKQVLRLSERYPLIKDWSETFSGIIGGDHMSEAISRSRYLLLTFGAYGFVKNPSIYTAANVALLVMDTYLTAKTIVGTSQENRVN